MLTVGEVISMLCKYASNNYVYNIMRMQIYNIEVEDDTIILYTVDSNTPNLIIHSDGTVTNG